LAAEFSGEFGRCGFVRVRVGMGGFDVFYPPFDKHFKVRRAGLVMIKAVPKRVLQVRDLKPLGTAPVVAIQERTMRVSTRHTSR